MSSQQAKPPGNQRKQIIVDRQWQISVSTRLGGVALGAGLFHLIALYYLSSIDGIEDLTGAQLSMLAIVVNSLYFLILAGGFTLFALRFTHRVAGPAQVLERAVDSLCAGRFDSRVSLRPDDYLQGLSTALARLTDQMRGQDAERVEFLRQLESKLTRDGREAALEMLRAQLPKDAASSPATQRSAA